MKFKRQVQEFSEKIEQITRTLKTSIEHSSITPTDAINLLNEQLRVIERCNQYLEQENEKS